MDGENEHHNCYALSDFPGASPSRAAGGFAARTPAADALRHCVVRSRVRLGGGRVLMALMWIRKKISQRGVAVLEVALVLPLVTMMFFAAMEYGWMLFRVQQVTNAAREGARRAILPGAIASDAQQTVTTQMTATSMGGSGYTTTLSPSSITGLAQGTQISITVQVPYTNVCLLGNMSLLAPFLPTYLHSSITMAREGP